MKKIFLAAALLFAATTFTGVTTANATMVLKSGDSKHIPASQVPAPVLASFDANFPTATNVKWEKEREHGQVQYKADFTQNGKRWRAIFAADGTLLSAGPR